jgi:hypothetical protein
MMPAAVMAQGHKKEATRQACVFDTAAHRDTTVEIISLRASHQGDASDDSVMSDAIASMIRQRFQPPPSIGTLFYPFTGPPKNPKRPPTQDTRKSAFADRPRVFGTLELVIEPDGTFSTLKWLDPTGEFATDAALLAALNETGGTSDARILATLAGQQHRPIHVQLVAQDSTDAIAPLVRLRIPEVEIDTPSAMRQPGKVDYPISERADRIEAMVDLQYIVDESGHTLPGSVRLMSAPDQDFAKSAIHAIMTSTFTPARTAGCPVKQLVAQRVFYTIGRR